MPPVHTRRSLSPLAQGLAQIAKRPRRGKKTSPTRTTHDSSEIKTDTSLNDSLPQASDPLCDHPMRRREAALYQRGHRFIVGVDEAGRGPLAGPVVAASCHIPLDVHIPGIDDSKKLDEAERERLYVLLTEHKQVKTAFAVMPHTEIDRVNILQATMRAMEDSVKNNPVNNEGTKGVDYVLVDGNRIPPWIQDNYSCEAIVGGDASCYAIAAASIIAKVTRDRIMVGLDAQYPQYGFAKHKGYGVAAHVAAIHKHGPSPVHRRSFAPVKHIVGFEGYENAQGKSGIGKVMASAQRVKPPAARAPRSKSGTK